MLVGGFAVSFIPKSSPHGLAIFWGINNSLHANSVVGGIASTYFMHAGKRAPTYINSLDDGPNMGFTAGCEYVNFLQYATFTHNVSP